jgi:hypothetical protein
MLIQSYLPFVKIRRRLTSTICTFPILILQLYVKIYFHSSQCRLIPYLHQRPIFFKASWFIVAILELIRGAQCLIEVIRSSGEKMWRVDAYIKIGLWWRYGISRHCDEWKYIIIGRIFESEIIFITPSLKISESSYSK